MNVVPIKKSAHVLVVDDDPSVLLTYRLILEQHGYRVTPAVSSTEARAALDKAPMDLLLCDLSLEHKLSGFDVIDYAHQLYPAMPAVLVTGYASHDVLDRAEGRDIVVLFKPIDIQEFLTTISHKLRSIHDQAKASGE